MAQLIKYYFFESSTNSANQSTFQFPDASLDSSLLLEKCFEPTSLLDEP